MPAIQTVVMRYSFIESSVLVRLQYLKSQHGTNLRCFCRQLSTSTQIWKKSQNKLVTSEPAGLFDDMVEQRRSQAKASIVIQVANPTKSASIVNRICSDHGTVNQIYHYSQRDKELLLFELDSEQSALQLLHSCSFNSATKAVPSLSPFLWLHHIPNNLNTSEKISLTKDQVANEESLTKQLLAASTLSEQISCLNDCYKLTEIEKRLRWITCMQVERMFSSLLPKLKVWPFGSSVNGCGRRGSDLDMVISLDGHSSGRTEKTPFVYQAKAARDDVRSQNKQHLALFGDILHHFGTGCTRIQKIMLARVPIVKFHHEFTGIDCDLSIGTLSGVYMSELLFLFGEIDPRFRPLVTTVRYWGSSTRLTSPTPGPTITNFTLTLLVVYYLQRCTILPSFNEMITQARPSDARFTNDIDCTFLRDPSVFRVKSKQNSKSLEELFIGFLQFVESFDFDERGISIIWGDTIKKPEECPLYVQNPLERELNVSKNVSIKEVAHLAMAARKALYELETCNAKEQWGLLVLPRAAVTSIGSRSQYKEHKQTMTSLSIKDLFLPEVNDDPFEVRSVKQKRK